MSAILDHGHGDSRLLTRSSYTTSFAHMGEVYLYHDLYGYILKMSPDILEFLNHFSTPIAPDQVCKHFDDAFGEMTPEAFVGIFLQFGCLVKPNHDQVNDVLDMVPVKARWTAWRRHKDGTMTIFAAWGERPVTTHLLSVEETTIWDRFDSETSLQILADEFGKDAVTALVKRLAHHDVQAVKLSALGMAYYKGRQHQKPPYLTSTMPYAHFDPATDTMPAAIEDIFSPEGYYEAEIDDADEQFNHQETTLAHLFRKPHPALKNRTYGQAIIDGLKGKGWIPDSGAIKVLEIGGGLGYMAEAVVKHLQGMGLQVTYDILELAPALAKAQRKQCADLPVTVHMGDCLKAEFPANDYDLVLSNEMIGDLMAIKLTREQLGMAEGMDDDAFEAALDTVGEAGELIRKFTVPIGDAPDPFYLNIGAWKLIGRLWDAVKPGGHVMLTEFGEMSRYPVLSTQLDHPELSIHFGQCALVAKSVGFEHDFEFVMDLIEMVRDLEGLSTTRSYFRAMKALLAAEGIELEKIGYTKGMFKTLLASKELRLKKHVGELEYDRIEDRLMGLVPYEFKALLLTRPAVDAAE